MASIASQTHSNHSFLPKSGQSGTTHVNGSAVGEVGPRLSGGGGQPSGPSVPAFVLRLAEHQKELHRFVWELFDEGLHTDVTIALDDGQYIKAHKLILSAFSSYFRQVLARISTPYQHPVLVVKDMLYEDVRPLIEFMYRGCITVPNHRLPQLLKCAKQLKIRGLYETNGENIDENNYNYCTNVSQTVETINPIVRDVKRTQFTSFQSKLDQKESIIFENNIKINNNYCNRNQEIVNEWLNNKKSIIPIPLPVPNLVPNAPKFPTPALTPMQQKIALDLTKRIDLNRAHNSNQCLPIGSMTANSCNAFLSPHPPLFRSTSVDECQLNKNKITMNGIDVRLKRAPSSLDGYLDNNNNDLEPDYRKEKKRNLNIFHAAKYRNRKKQQLELLFAEESELQKRNGMAKMQIEKLESTILSLIWQQTKRTFNAQTVFSCPVCGNAQNEVPKLRSHINMLHNDTEALMKFLMLQRSPEFTNCANNAINKSTKGVANSSTISTVSVPFSANSNQ